MPAGTASPVTGLAILTSTYGCGRPSVRARSSAESSGRVWVMQGEASVCAKVMVNGMPSADSTRCTTVGGTVAPPENASLTLEKSVLANPGWPSSARIMVGTPPSSAERSDSIRFRISPGSNGAITWVARCCTGPSVRSTHPAVWNIGIGFTHTSPGCARRICAQNRALLVIPRWRRTAPFGKPVVPEVYWIWAVSSGTTSGSRSVAEPELMKSSQFAREIASRRPGRSPRTSSNVFARSAPR